jgi:hypothetical protein
MADEEIPRLLSDLFEIAPKLGKESDSINSVIEGFQRTLCDLDLGLAVWVDEPILETERLPSRHDDVWGPVTSNAYLGFDQRGGEWKLLVQVEASRSRLVADDDDDEEIHEQRWQELGPTPLLQASRGYQLAALNSFRTLLNRMKSRADVAFNAIQEAKKFVE